MVESRIASSVLVAPEVSEAILYLHKDCNTPLYNPETDRPNQIHMLQQKKHS